MVNKSKRGIVGLVLIFLIVIGDLIVGFADSPGKPSTFTRALADTLYCKVTGSNCGQLGTNEYCDTSGIPLQTGIANCNDQYCVTSTFHGLGLHECFATAFTYFIGQSNTKTTFSTSTFTSYVTASCCVPTLYTLGDQIFCQAFAQYQVSNILTVVDFRIKDTAVGGVTGVAWRVNPGVASANETLSFMPSDQFGNSGAQPLLALQFSVTGTGTMTVYHGSILCTDDTGSPNNPVG